MIRAGTLIIVLLLSWSSSASAQVAPTETQKQLNRQAYQKMADGSYEAAIDLYLQSIEKGPLNVTWLNLGRAYQKSGQCADAYAAFENVSSAPRVEKPSPEVVADTLERFREQLEDWRRQ